MISSTRVCRALQSYSYFTSKCARDCRLGEHRLALMSPSLWVKSCRTITASASIRQIPTKSSSSSRNNLLSRQTKEWLGSETRTWNQFDTHRARALMEEWMLTERNTRRKAETVTRIYVKWLGSLAKRTLEKGDHALLVEMLNRVLNAWKQHANAEFTNTHTFEPALRAVHMTMTTSSALQSANDATFSSLFDLLAMNPSLQTLDTAREFLHQRLKSVDISYPDLQFWNSFLNVLAKATRLDSSIVHEAEDVLLSLGDMADERTMASVLEAWAHSGQKDAGQHAQDHLNRMLQADQFNTVCFNLTIRAWASSENPEQAESCLMSMLRCNTARPEISLQPDARSFLEVIRGWSRAGEPERAERVLNLLQSIHDQTGDDHLQPTSEMLTALWNAWAQRGNSGPKVDALLQIGIQRLLNDPDRKVTDWPSPHMFTVAIKAWAATQDPDAPLHAERLLAQMEGLQEAGFANLAPNHYHISAVINSWNSSQRLDASERVLALLQFCSEKLGLNTAVYNAALSFFAKQGDTKVAEDLLCEMKNVPEASPSIASYSSVIRAYYNSRHVDASARSEALVSEVEDLFDQGDYTMRPTEGMYFSAILAKSLESAEAVEELFWRVIARHNQNKDCTAPSVVLCNLVLRNWSQSVDVYAPERAENFLLKIEQECIAVPDDTSFRHVIEAWGRSGRRSAPRRIEKILARLCRGPIQNVNSTNVAAINAVAGRFDSTPGMLKYLQVLGR